MFTLQFEDFHEYNNYDSHIMLYWKGEKKNFADIFHSLHNAIPHPSYVYAMLDIYLKFLIAVAYYETVLFLNCIKSQLEKFIISDITENIIISKKSFPDKFQCIIHYCNEYFKELLDESFGKKNTSKSISTENKLFNEFEILGIFVYPNVSKLSTQCTDFLAFSLITSVSIKRNLFNSFVSFVVEFRNSVCYTESFIERYTRWYNGMDHEDPLSFLLTY